MATPQDDEVSYDVVIVGAGFAGAILAKQLVAEGKSVLILEAGADRGEDWRTYRDYLDQYFLAQAKTPNSPYPNLPTLPSPSVLDITAVHGTQPDTNGYFVQQGPLPFGSNYLRAYGGTSLHWLGTSLRMFPADFEMRTRFGRGVDWPFGYQELRPYYEQAEWEIGVSANAEDQTPEALGIHVSEPDDGKNFFESGYDYPMHPIPDSYVARYIAEAGDGTPVATGVRSGWGGKPEPGLDVVDIKVSNTPQGRNSTPRHGKKIMVAGREREAFEPRGGTGAFAFIGQRCEGNSSCIPICPIQAKYTAMKTLADARANRTGQLQIQTQSIASQVETAENGCVSGLVYKRYPFPGVPQYELRRVRAEHYVLAGGAVENATLALASGLCRSSQELGRNLMDHPYMMTWGLARDPVGPFRGPGSTSGIGSFRDGVFRNEKAAFRLEIGNWGWNFAAGAPYSDVARMVGEENLFGRELRQKLFHRVQRQVRVGILVEQLPEPSNRVTIDPAYRDPMGQYRPVIGYDVSDYSRAGLALAHDACIQLYRRLGVENHTAYNPSDSGYFTHEGKGYTVFGSGHIVGTHRIGIDPKTSVTQPDMRCHDHENLWMVGAGSMPTIATSNPTLTLAAMGFMAAEAINRALQ